MSLRAKQCTFITFSPQTAALFVHEAIQIEINFISHDKLKDKIFVSSCMFMVASCILHSPNSNLFRQQVVNYLNLVQRFGSTLRSFIKI